MSGSIVRFPTACSLGVSYPNGRGGLTIDGTVTSEQRIMELITDWLAHAGREQMPSDEVIQVFKFVNQSISFLTARILSGPSDRLFAEKLIKVAELIAGIGGLTLGTSVLVTQKCDDIPHQTVTRDISFFLGPRWDVLASQVTSVTRVRLHQILMMADTEPVLARRMLLAYARRGALHGVLSAAKPHEWQAIVAVLGEDKEVLRRFLYCSDQNATSLMHLALSRDSTTIVHQIYVGLGKNSKELSSLLVLTNHLGLNPGQYRSPCGSIKHFLGIDDSVRQILVFTTDA